MSMRSAHAATNDKGNDAVLKSDRVMVRRRSQRGRYDFATVAAILDASFICHVGFSIDRQPYVIPTMFGRRDGTLYFHGAAANRMLRHMAGGFPVCVTVTIVDGLVLARSAFHHSMNYRSVVILGSATVVTDEEKMQALRVISDHVIAGRWAEIRAPNAVEMNATSVLKIDITEASAKIRQGPPVDDEADMNLPCWAGVLPLAMVPQAPIADLGLRPGIAVPGYVAAFGESADRAQDEPARNRQAEPRKVRQATPT
jgi:nitroimidazol reductase NimA-like FMN-containing flavoprotein (pyridoxamine 5'-phosphate oxidase superfamily)